MKRSHPDRLSSTETQGLRRKLVWGYTVAIILILACSLTVSFWALKHFLTTSLEESFFLVLDAEIGEATPTLAAWKAGQGTPPYLDYSGNSTEPPEALLHEQGFTIAQFWFSADGTLLMAETHLESRDALVDSFRNWPHPNREIRAVSITPADGSKTWHFIAAADDVYQEGELMGKVVVGVNLTPFMKLTDLYYAVCLATIVAVSALSFFVGNYLAAKAILPVEKTMEKQRHFVADASHELRTPLSILLSSVDMLSDTDENRDLVSGMKDEILHMRSLTDSLLTLARSDEEEAKRVIFDLSDMSRSVVSSMQVVADAKDIQIVPSVTEGIQVFGDELKIEQLFGVLLDNAVKYSPEHSVVHLEVSAAHGEAKIVVTDRGTGIPQEYIEHIFDRFYRVDRARSRQTGGYGLGLSIAQNIVDLHKGKIQVRSAEGKGTAFSIVLPLNNRSRA